MLGKKKYIRTRAKYFGEFGLQAQESYKRYKKEKMNLFATDYISCPKDYIGVTTVSLASCNEAPQVKMPCQKGNNPMYVDNDKHIESSKINYLNDRRETLFYSKRADLQKQFGLVDDETPTTANDLVKRIQDGKFVIPADKGDTATYEAARFIKWRDPAAKKDQAGFDAAVKQYAVVNQDTKDTIAIGTPAEGLAAVKAMDAWTPTVGTA